MTHWQKALVSMIFLAAMLAFGYRQTLAPPIDTGSELDYAALNRHVAAIADQPHPIGSESNRRVRYYIVNYFKALGLATEVQKTTVVYRHPNRIGRGTTVGQVENIIARLPGSTVSAADEASDLVVMVHYDSVPSGPGAADDASGVASVLETARILVNAPPPAHDVIFLITDGEEAGLLGAQGFFRQHPAAKKAGLVLNFEARGSYGASFMFETSAGNAWLVEPLAGSVPALLASSLSYEIYRRMPNDTDLTISKGEGIPGLNFAFLAGLSDYHAMTDTVGNLDRNSLAQQANYVLESTRYFANLEKWRKADGDLTYFNLWRGVLVRYSQGVATALGAGVLLMGLWLFVSALRKGHIRPGPVLAGLLAMLALFLFTWSLFGNLLVYLRGADAGIFRIMSLREWPLLAWFVTTLGLTLWYTGRLTKGLRKSDVFLPPLLLSAIVLLAGGSSPLAFAIPVLLVPLLLLLRALNSRPDVWTASLVTWWLLTALLLTLAPNASYLLVWPLASVLLGIAVQRRVHGGAAGFLTGLISCVAPLLLLPPVYILAYLALGLAQPQVLMILCSLTLLLIWPLTRSIAAVADGKAALVLLGAGVLMTAGVVFGRGFDIRHPRPEELFYAIDVDRQQAFWGSQDARPDSWLGEFMGAAAQDASTVQILPGYERQIRIRESELPAYAAARLSVQEERVKDGVRELHLHLETANTGAQVNLLFASDAGIETAAVNGFEVAVPAGGEGDRGPSQAPEAGSWWRWRWYGLPPSGADIVLTLPQAKSLTVKIIEVDYRLPAGAPPRPQNSIRRPYSWSDSTVIYQTLKLE
jgi:hypothetical protein